MQPGRYTLWQGDTQLAYTGSTVMAFGGMGGMPPANLPEGFEMPEDFHAPEGMTPPEGFERPEGMEPPEGMEHPNGMERPEDREQPEGMEHPGSGRGGERGGFGRGHFGSQSGEAQTVFEITAEGGSFSGVGKAE